MAEHAIKEIFALFKHCCFNGHTHLPGIFSEPLEYQAPEEFENEWRLDGRKVLCNVGSVGQPRDGNWRACYALLAEGVVRFRRVDYDVETTVRKIRDVDDLDDILGERLRRGE